MSNLLKVILQQLVGRDVRNRHAVIMAVGFTVGFHTGKLEFTYLHDGQTNASSSWMIHCSLFIVAYVVTRGSRQGNKAYE